MSTKMLHELLSQYEDMIGTSRSEVGTGALKELEAIEKAATDWKDSGSQELSQHGADVLDTIATEVFSRETS